MAELSKELKEIKKKYGETFMHICRDNFSTLLEKEGLLSKVLDKYFAANSKSIGDDIIINNILIDFKNFIYSKIDVEKEEKQIIEDKTPYEILKEAGYKLIECTSEEEIQEFRKYYDPDEVICTIYNGGRLNSSVVFFAVKEDVENIKREDFKKPQREDEYGTSVLGIQFDKYGICTPHIITRYNHTVNNPNGTYGNDLDRIAPGLTKSFAKLLHERGLELNNSNIEEFEFPGYTVASDGKYYKYNMEENGIYYCPGNITIEGGNVKKLEKPESQMLIDYFILDIKEKTIRKYDRSYIDSFLDAFENIEKIQMKKNPDKEKQTRIITIKIKDSNLPITIEIDKDNNIVGYNNPELKQIGDCFLYRNKELSELNLPQLTEIESDFLSSNKELKELNLPQLTEVGYGFLVNNEQLSELNLPQLTKVGKGFLYNNYQLKELNVLELKEVGNDFLRNNEELRELNLPKLTKVGNCFLYRNRELSELNLPQLTKVGKEFLYNNYQLKELNLLELKEVGDDFLRNNNQLRKLNLPQLTKVGNDFLYDNKQLRELNLPELTQVGDYFLGYNEELREINLPQLTKVGIGFFYNNYQLRKLNLPELTKEDGCFLCCNTQLSELNLPQLTEVGDYFLGYNVELRELYLPKLKEEGDRFLRAHPKREELIANMHEKSEKQDEKTHINPKKIVELDRDAELTITEVNLGKELIEKTYQAKKDNIQK